MSFSETCNFEILLSYCSSIASGAVIVNSFGLSSIHMGSNLLFLTYSVLHYIELRNPVSSYLQIPHRLGYI